MTTIEIIAKKAGVSRGTVDRVLHDRGQVKPETAERVRAVMEEIMTKIMYEIPSDLAIQKVLVTESCVQGGQPLITRDESHPRPKSRVRTGA